MHWVYIIGGVYLLILMAVCLRIIYETRSATKTMAYLLLAVFIPVGGIVFYLLFGVNFWKTKAYSNKSDEDEKLLEHLKKEMKIYGTETVLPPELPAENRELAVMLQKVLSSPLTRRNKLQLLINGEEKFPEVLEAIRNAKHHIHIQYYIFAQDNIGEQIEELLIKKATEGVRVRFIYDDFGSPNIKKSIEDRMRKAGIEIYPFQKVMFYLLANRLNYRNHRKTLIIDGQTAFTGGINVCDKYINNGTHKLFWRDTHLRIDGPGVFYLQYLFLTDWKFCCDEDVELDEFQFPVPATHKEDSFLQVAASGPESKQPSVLFSLLQSIFLAKKEILITTPYFIPGDSILEALKIAALSGLSVKLLAPGICDSKLVNAASKSYYEDLLCAGVEVYVYKKGFVHAKTLVADGNLSIIGTANMDYRSFELNFEANVLVYDRTFAEELRSVFYKDLEEAEKIDKEEWCKRSAFEQLPERLARLFSHVL
ncbi:cardiolipin synthase [Lacibacter sp. H375]|uniref:cardiolipin synthase n=1 Tax=Lacibacter sp. H375 TaxID=3133424 RepID=UPI0030C2AB6A